MKKLIIILAIAVAAAAISCKDEEVKKNDAMIGTWQLTHVNTVGCTDGEGNGDYAFGCTADYCEKLIITTANSVKKEVTLLGNPSSDSGTYLIMGDNIEICMQQGTSCANGDYAMNTDKTVFTVKYTDGATGCISTYTYTKL